MANLRKFLEEDMRMTGPYQPAIIRCLLAKGGEVSLREVAQYLASIDKKAIDYLVGRLKVYPKTVLKKHNIAMLKDGQFKFSDTVMPTQSEWQELQALCEQKLADYYSRFEEPSKPSGWGLMRVQMITEKPYCELCGARPTSTNDIELDIDHIKPKSLGGPDDRDNLQVLCHRCNRGKNNAELISAAEAHKAHAKKVQGCLFCELPQDDKKRVIGESEHVYWIRDNYPVTKGHTLIIPKSHLALATELRKYEVLAIDSAMKKITEDLKQDDESISGFNCGYNIGSEAGQTIHHVHFHIIPRRKGDVDFDPRGGIRGVIPSKRAY